MGDTDLRKILKKACSIEETAPKRKHVRSCILYTWDHKSASFFFEILKSQPFVAHEIQIFKMLIVIHKVVQEGHPSALKQAMREREWIKSLERIHPTNGTEYGKLIKEYVRYLVKKLNFHATHKGFHNGIFEYEEYVSLVNVSDPDEGYETIIELMGLMNAIDNYTQFVFATLQNNADNNNCKIASLIPMVAETYGIYKFITSMLRAMYRQLGEGDPALQPLKERYNSQHARLFEFYADCSSIKFLTTLVTIPRLPTQPPNVSQVEQVNENAKEIKFQKKESTPQPTSRPQSQPIAERPISRPASRPQSRNESRSSSSVILPNITNASMMIPTVTGAAAAVMPMVTGMPIQPQQQQQYWAQQQLQIANEQQRLEQERQKQLQEQQEKQQLFQQTMSQAQQQLQNMQLQQQNDLMALNSQYERDQNLLKQYDQRVQQLENEIATINENFNLQLNNKDEMVNSLNEQLDMWEKKYDSLAKLYSQLRSEHLQLLPQYKKLKIKVNSAHESIKQKEKLEQKMKQKDLQMADLIKDRDRLRLENDRNKNKLLNIDENNNNNNNNNNEQNPNGIDETTLSLIIDACLESGIVTIQESIFNLESQGNWTGPLSTASHLMTLIEGVSEKATEFATSFNDMIVDGLTLADHTSVILNISEFSTAIATLITNTKAYSSTTLNENESDELIDMIKKCGREGQYFFEDLMSDNLLSLKDDEEKTDVVINANVDIQEKLQELSLILEPYLNILPSHNEDTNAQSQLIATVENIEKLSEQLRVNIDVNVPKPILTMSLAIIDAIIALVKAAISCQNEIADTTKIPLSQFYKKNSRWTEGLISAAKTVGSATNVLISIAGNLINEDKTFTPEEFIVASKEVAASTAQLVAASRVKTVPHSKAQNNLEQCSNAVSETCKHLVSQVMGNIQNGKSQNETPIDFSSQHAVKTAEMEQQVEILKLEQSLSSARKRLGEIRKHAYYLNDEDDE